MFVDHKEHGEVRADEVGRLMLRAADLIERCGHCHGTTFDGKGFCVVGALGFVERGNHYYDFGPLTSLARERLMRSLGIDSLINWNDGCTKDEVVAKLRAVALAG